MEIVLFEPEIPPNTGNIARLCAAACIDLHLIEPLGFSLEDRYLKRAGLDYWEHVSLRVWKNFDEYLTALGEGKRIIATSSRQGVAMHFAFQADDVLLFGPETRGLPEDTQDRTQGEDLGQSAQLELINSSWDYSLPSLCHKRYS